MERQRRLESENSTLGSLFFPPLKAIPELDWPRRSSLYRRVGCISHYQRVPAAAPSQRAVHWQLDQFTLWVKKKSLVLHFTRVRVSRN